MNTLSLSDDVPHLLPARSAATKARATFEDFPRDVSSRNGKIEFFRSDRPHPTLLAWGIASTLPDGTPDGADGPRVAQNARFSDRSGIPTERAENIFGKKTLLSCTASLRYRFISSVRSLTKYVNASAIRESKLFLQTRPP